MHTDVYEMFYGQYKFTAELEMGSETGEKQLIVWFAEKVAMEYVDLARFSVDLLLNALQEPLHSRLRAQLEAEKITCQQEFETYIATLQSPLQTRIKHPEKKLTSKVKRDIRALRRQTKRALQRLEAQFIKRELIPLERQCFDLAMLQRASHVFGEPRFLRDFYFEEANQHYISNFCQKFALDEVYRQEVLHGKTHWAQRNALFMRNLLTIAGEEMLFAKDGSYNRKIREFFHWLDVHCEEILALPEYQWLQDIDSVLADDLHKPDHDIRLAVELFNRVPDVTVQFSCQGVSGKVRFQQYDLLTVSSHQENAFVAFSSLGAYAHDAIIDLLSAYPTITTDCMPYNFALHLVLRSTGDNLSFRKELLALVHRVLERVEEDQCRVWQTYRMFRWQHAIYPEYCPRTTAPGGMLPSRLAWICQPERLERTLYLLFHLNHWAKAREYLFYDDRQGLYKVKTVVLQQAYQVGALHPIAYIDGSATFARDYYDDLAIDMAVEVFIDRLTMSFDGKDVLTDKFDLDARKLFTRIMGYEAKTLAESQALDKEQARAFIGEALHALVNQARSTRQPIPSEELAALFIQPEDLFDIHMSRKRLSPRWDELDESEAKQLDPEGLSLIAFQYNSSTAHYVFHLPFRIAAKFLSQQLVGALQNHASTSREAGTFYGRAITDIESQQYPIATLVRELLIDISAICPHNLVKKEHHFRSPRGWSVLE